MKREMTMKSLARRPLLFAIAGLLVGAMLSRLVIIPLIHIAGDPWWLRPTIISGTMTAGAVLFLLVTYLKRRRVSTKK